MATSGVYSFNLTRNDLINRSAVLAGILDPEGGTLSASQITYGSNALNSLITALQTDGLQLTKRKTLAIPLRQGQSQVFLGTGTEALVKKISTTLVSYLTTTLTVGNTVGMANNDPIAVTLNDGTLYKTTISSFTSTTITLAALVGTPLTNGEVFTYTSLAGRPIRILDGYIRQVGGNDTPIKVMNKEEYYRFGQKTSPGTTVNVFYDPDNTSGNVLLYPVVGNNTTVLFLEVLYPYQSMANASDDFDFPQEWWNPLAYLLAVEFGYEYGVDEKRLTKLEARAQYWHDKVQGASQEPYVQFGPDTKGGWGY